MVRVLLTLIILVMMLDGIMVISLIILYKNYVLKIVQLDNLEAVQIIHVRIVLHLVYSVAQVTHFVLHVQDLLSYINQNV